MRKIIDNIRRLITQDILINNLIQFVFIFSSVYFAFWLTNQGELKRLQKIERKAAESIYREIQENIRQLEEAYAFHEGIRDRLFAYADSVEKDLIATDDLKPRDHLLKVLTRRSNSLGLANVRRDAWEMLRSSEAYVIVDYEIASELGRLYRMQSTGVESTAQKIVTEIFNSKLLYQPEESEAMIWLAAWSFRELAGQEQYLAEMSKQMLIVLEKQYPFLAAISHDQPD